MASLAITAGSVREAAAGQTSTLTFTLTRDGDLSEAASAQWYAYSQWLGDNPLRPPPPQVPDFVDGYVLSGTATFAPGVAEMAIALAVAGDDMAEPDERVSLYATSGTLGTASATATIESDEALFDLVGLRELDEESAGGQFLAFSVIREGDPWSAVTVDFAVVGTGATPVDGADFLGGVLPAGTLTFAPGRVRADLPVILQPDGTPEPWERFRILLSNPGPGAGLMVDPWLDVVVGNNDLPPGETAAGPDTAATIAPGGQVEGAVDARGDHDWYRADLVAGTTYRVVVRGEGLATPFAALRDAGGAVLAETTLAGTADAPVGRGVFHPGGTSPWFIDVASVPAVAYWHGGGYRLELDPVTPVAVVADMPAQAEGAAGDTASFRFTLTRTELLDRALSLSWQVEGDGALPVGPEDFVGGAMPAGQVAFAPGQATATVTVATRGNDAAQGHRGLRLVVDSADNPVTETASAGAVLREDDALGSLPVVGGDAGAAVAGWCDGPVPGVTRQWVSAASGGLEVAAPGPGWFLRTGAGDDAIVAASGTNVLDGGGGSNFLVGGDGVDHFFVDLREGASGPRWTTIANAAPGDTVTLWGLAPGGDLLSAMRVDGPAGWQGETLFVADAGGQPVAVTLAGVGVPGGHDVSIEMLSGAVGPGVLLRID